jgi:HSP20 family protein
MDIVRWSPFRELEAMERRMRRAFEDAGMTAAATPAADVYETESEFVVELEVPGYDEKELQVEVTDHTLCVKGERAEEKEKKENTFHLHERLEKSFERRFTLPTEADLEKTQASFTKGVLEVHVAKATEAKPRTVPISK